MFRTKEDVKRHVQEIFRKVKNENERHRRCYNIAQQFYKVRDYESAKHYLSLYLSVKEDSPLAHKLQGQIWEALGDKVRALNAYKTSLEYDAKQADLLLKLCELLYETDIAMDPDRAQYWCERGSDIFPYDPIIFQLKEKLLKRGGKANNQAFEDLINSELKARPDDVSVRTRLMQMYLDTGRSKAAFNHGKELENDQVFRKDLMWYECFAQVCKAYADDLMSQVDWQTYVTWISVLDKICIHSMFESAGKKLVDCVQAVFSMDQVLFKAAKLTVSKEHSELYRQFVRHMSAQLCFHIATLILKRAKKEPSNWKEATSAASPLLFLALSSPVDTEAPWCLTLGSYYKRSVETWASEGYYRVSQAGYIILSLAKGTGNQYTEKVTQKISNNWRERIFQRLFTVLDLRSGIATSQFVHSELLAKVIVRLPIHESGYLRTRELVPVYEKLRESLHHLVWLGLEAVKQNNNKLPPAKHNHKLPQGFQTYSFTKLKLTTHDLTKMSPETLTILDVDAFLYATTLSAIATFEEELLNGYFSNDRPVTLPADITNLLCTQEQINWWEAACQVNTKQFNTKTNLVVLRQDLQRGLEVVRVDGNHGLEVQLIVKLARTFADRAASVTAKAGDQAALESRAYMYWNAAIPLLERIERKEAVRTSNTRLFEYPKKELSAAEVCSLLEEGRYFVGCQFMKLDQHEKAIEAFKPLRSPYASFNQALIYKKLASLEVDERPREEITSEMRSKHVILLSKARECLNLTNERIRIDRHHPLHLTLPDHMSEVEAALSRIEPDPDMVNQSDDVNVSEQSMSSLDSPTAGGDSVRRLNGRSHQHSTPRRHFSEYKRSGELVDIGQLMQIQTLHEEMKKMQEKLDTIVENMIELRRDVNKLKPSGADDLYLFGDDEEYPDDVLNSQYPTPFVPSYTAPPQATPTFYPTPTRGVQGTSTVTYGAPPVAQPPPPVIPLIPVRMPLDSALAGYPPTQNLAFYNQGAVPQPLPDFLHQTIPKPVMPPQQPPPVNVVITTSDTLPTGPPPVQPTLSVTIPPQHRLGGLPVTKDPVSTPPHNFQIAMPATATTPNLEKSPIVVPDEEDSDDDNEVGYDPCPNFQPIIPLPNEVSVTTGEEDDDILFENRAKLFRYLDKEWKERGVGVVKILKNRSTNKVRLLMRRDQVHKVCANHLLRSDMELTMLKNSDRALVWVANDFAEEVVQLEKFCIKFKTPEQTLSFRDIFNDAKMKYGQSPQKVTKQLEKNVSEINQSLSTLAESKNIESTGKVNLGGFTFTSPPKLKDLKDEQTKIGEEKKDAQITPSPFAAFKFTPQKPTAKEYFSRPNTILMQPTLPLFAGLNNTQNKHTLFDKINEESDFSTEDNNPNVNPTKVILKQPILTPVQSVPSVDNTNENSGKTEIGHKVLPESNKTQLSISSKPQASVIESSIKETPKSILKDPPASTVTYSSAKSSPSTKHVLFQDSPSQQTPTLAALLTSPKTEVLDFAALSKLNENKPLNFDTSKKASGFAGAGSTVFGSSRVRKESEGDNAEEFIPSAEFKPVIPLPDLVEVKTGEESEEVLFNERAKLLRFDSDTKEWKERGLGQMKILKDPTTGITRFLMRREFVHKVCCNHRIIQSIELKASTSERAWTWYAIDYSEGEMKNELFAIRFKTIESAKAFKEKVDLIQKQLREDSTSKRSCPDSGEKVSSPSYVWNCQFCHVSNAQDSLSCKSCSKPNSDGNSLPKLSELFRPKAGSWECKACYTVNGIKDNTCVSCDSPKEKPKSSGSPSPAISATPPTLGPSLAEMFKPKAGSWECGGCLVRNESDKTVCPACATPKPGHENDAKEAQKSVLSSGSNSFSFGLKQTEITSPTFSFGVNPTATENKETGFNFGIKPTSEISKSSFVFGAKPGETTVKSVGSIQSSSSSFDFKPESTESKDKSIVTPATGFTFDQGSTTKTLPPFTFSTKSNVLTSAADSTTAASETSNAFKFGNIFGDSSVAPVSGAPTPPNSASDTKSKFAFGENGQFEFNFSGVKSLSPRSPGNKSPRSPVTGQDSDSEPEEEDNYEADHLVFQPVVPLPDKVPVYTGEEDEAVLYSHRAKLFRFAQGEWKERGVGDIKLLRHHTTHKIRMLMRREPIMKICLNHFLTTELMFSLKDEKTWLWSAPDFADNHITNEQFCLRFKNAEIATEFKAAIDSAKGELQGAKAESSATPSDGVTNTTSDAHEVEIVYEAQVSKELRDAALKLMLPKNFYRYLEAPPCSGCRGCEPDTEEKESEPVRSTPIIKPSTVSLPSTTTTVSQPFTFTVKTTSSADPKLSSMTTTVSQPFTFSVKPSSTTASSIFGATEPKLSSVTTTVSQPFTFSVKTTSSSSTPTLFGSTEPKLSSGTLTASQPFTFSVKSTAPSLIGSAEPKSFPVTSTVPTNLFSFAVTSTASSVLESTESRVSSVTTTSAPLFSSPSTDQSSFSFSLNTSTASATPTAPLFSSPSTDRSSFSFSIASDTPSASPFFSNASQTVFFSGSPVFQSPVTIKSVSGTTETSSNNLLPKTGPLLFGKTPVTQSATTLSFGSSQVTTPLFGGSVFIQTPKESPLFNNAPATPPIQSNASLYDVSTTVNSSNSNSFFGNLSTFQSPTTSVFGGSSTQTNTSMIGTPSPQTVSATNGDPPFLFKHTTSFSDIAATGKQPAFESDKSSNFAWSGAGTTVFGSKKEGDSGGESGGEEGEADATHDPIFEPIVPLPDAIEVRTGEEEEDILFCQRAKFFRYDTDGKEWKERGVGNMKILKHQQTNSYRLLLRREQVHKVVCNQLIMGELELQSLSNSDKAFCWAGMNMTEEYSEPQLEKLAVRFKNCDQANEFKSKLEECIDIVKARKENAISEILDSSAELLEPSVTIEEVVTEDSEEGEVEEAEYGEEDEPLFEKRATLHVRNSKNSWSKISQGDLSINYHQEDASIIFFKKDNGDHMAITIQTENNIQKLSGKEIVFYGQDYDGEMNPNNIQEFKAEFSTSQATEEFLAVMNELMELSQVCTSYGDSEQED